MNYLLHHNFVEYTYDPVVKYLMMTKMNLCLLEEAGFIGATTFMAQTINRKEVIIPFGSLAVNSNQISMYLTLMKSLHKVGYSHSRL